MTLPEALLEKVPPASVCHCKRKPACLFMTVVSLLKTGTDQVEFCFI